MNIYIIAKIWKEFITMLWLMKLDKGEKKTLYPCFGSSDRATQREGRKTFHFSSTLIQCLRDPGSVPVRKLGRHSSTKRVPLGDEQNTVSSYILFTEPLDFYRYPPPTCHFIISEYLYFVLY